MSVSVGTFALGSGLAMNGMGMENAHFCKCGTIYEGEWANGKHKYPL